MGTQSRGLPAYTEVWQKAGCGHRYPYLLRVLDHLGDGMYSSVLDCGLCNAKISVEFDPATAPPDIRQQLDTAGEVRHHYDTKERAAFRARELSRIGLLVWP